MSSINDKCGVKYTSLHVYNGSIANDKDQTGIFDCGVLVDPFSPLQCQDTTDRMPIMCVQCAAYLSVYARINRDTGEWACPICSSINPVFHSSYSSMSLNTQAVQDYQNVHRERQLRSIYPELLTRHIDFVEKIPIHTMAETPSYGVFGTSSSGGKVLAVSRFIFALDSSLCSDTHAVHMLCKGITSLPDVVEVCIVVYGANMHVLRLGGAAISVVDPVTADVFPGGSDQSSLYTHLIRRGVYNCKASMLKAHIDAVRQSLGVLGDSESIEESAIANQVACTVDALVGTAAALSSTRASAMSDTCAATSTRLVMLSAKSLQCSSADSVEAGEPLPLLARFGALGSEALRHHCSIDVFHASLRASCLDHFDALVWPSGGSVVSGNDFEDTHMMESFHSLLASPSHVAGTDSSLVENIYPGLIPTLEIRTCGKLGVERVVGPIVSAEDVAQHCSNSSSMQKRAYSNSAQATSSSKLTEKDGKLSPEAAQLAVDGAHLAHSLHFVRDNTNTSNKQEAFLSTLVQRNQNQLVLSGINMRKRYSDTSEEAQDSITVQLKLAIATGTQMKSPYLQPGSAAIIGSTGQPEPQLEGDHEAAYVQIVVRYHTYSAESTATLRKVTRIYTQRLPLSSSREEVLESLDARLWGHVFCRGLVADYHTHCIDSFGGAVRSKLDEQGQYALSTLKNTTIDVIDATVKAIIENFPPTARARENALDICRILYHLREGPLFDGPAANPIEAYLLRSRYLRSPYTHALRVVAPLLLLTVSAATPVSASTSQLGTPSASTASLTSLYPPPPSAAASVAQANSTDTSSPALCMMYPPPPGASNSAPASATGLSTAELTMRFPPPPTPSSTCPDSGTVPHPPPPSTLLPPPSVSGRTPIDFVEVPPDSVFLLPATVAVLDCGDRIIIRQNPSRASESGSDTPVEDRKAASLVRKFLTRVTQQIKATVQMRYPAPVVHVLARAGTPQDRMLYCRLAPAHMDSTEGVLAILQREFATGHAAPVHDTNCSSSSSTMAVALHNLGASLTPQEVQRMVAQAPFTDQPFFAKYLSQLSPTLAGKVLSKIVPRTEASRGSIAPVSQNMDRGVVGIFVPPPSLSAPSSAVPSPHAPPPLSNSRSSYANSSSSRPPM